MKNYIAVLILVIGSLGLNAQSSIQDDKQKEHPIIKALIENNWIGTGVLMGNEATFTMDWHRVLGNKFIKLEFQNKRKSENNESIVFNATGYYKIVNDTILGTWFDNRGMTFPLKGSLEENNLTIVWGTDDTEMGKTIYQYINDNKISVQDFVMNNGNYFKFGSATYSIKE